MIFFLNGKFVPEEEAVVSVMDRGFLYGDGLFETVRGAHGDLPFWRQHWARLCAGANYMGITIPFSEGDLFGACKTLLEKNGMSEAILRIQLTRGIGKRGYSPLGAKAPTVVITVHPVPTPPTGFKVVTSKFTLQANDPFAAFKNCNKLRQILARAEADAAGADEVLLLNEKSEAVEGSSTNLFWFEGETLWTPPLSAGILPGVARGVVLESARHLGMRTAEGTVTIPKLKAIDGAFLTASTWGCVEIEELDGSPLTKNPKINLLQQAFLQRVHQR